MCTAIYKQHHFKKDNMMGKGEGNEGLAPKLWKSLILVTWNHMSIQTQQNCSRKKEGELISSLEWNDMSQTNTWPRSFIIVGVISEL